MLLALPRFCAKLAAVVAIGQQKADPLRSTSAAGAQSLHGCRYLVARISNWTATSPNASLSTSDSLLGAWLTVVARRSAMWSEQGTSVSAVAHRDRGFKVDLVAAF